jgi:hypothetical protein
VVLGHSRINARLVTDGLMFPWQTNETRGTIYILTHSREVAFGQGDLRIMEILADFAAIGVLQLRQQKLLIEQIGVVAEAATATTWGVDGSQVFHSKYGR